MSNPITGALEKLKNQQQWLAAVIFALVALVVWVSVSLLSSQRTTGIDPALRKLAEPLTPTLNAEVIQEMQNREYFAEDTLDDVPIYVTVTDDTTRAETIILKGSNATQLDQLLTTPAAPDEGSAAETASPAETPPTTTPSEDTTTPNESPSSEPEQTESPAPVINI